MYSVIELKDIDELRREIDTINRTNMVIIGLTQQNNKYTLIYNSTNQYY